MAAELAAKTGAKAKPAPTLKWLKSTPTAAPAASTSLEEKGLGPAAQQRAAAAASGGTSSETGVGGSSGGSSGGGSIQIKEPVLKSLRNAPSLPVAGASSSNPRDRPVMIEVLLNDRLGKKVRVKCNSNDTIGDLKKLGAAQLGTRPEKIRIQKWYTVYKDHIRLDDYEVHDGMSLELYYM